MCVGSYGARADNDIVAMTREFAPRIHFAHLRNVAREPDGSFHEAEHLDGDSDMIAVIEALMREEADATRRGEARTIPMRPDHGHLLGDDANKPTNPGYSYIGRLKGPCRAQGRDAGDRAHSAIGRSARACRPGVSRLPERGALLRPIRLPRPHHAPGASSMNCPFDPRVTPARPDLAAASLRGAVEAPRYAEGRSFQVIEAAAPLRREPRADAPLETEALLGEAVKVYDESEGWGWVQLLRNSYVGYLPFVALAPVSAEPTHRVAALRTHAYPGPSIKLPPVLAPPFGALVAIRAHDGDFAVAADGLHYWARHLAPVGARETDFVTVAEQFLGAPYLWGGRTSDGIDCSGLVQTALMAAGVESPRDSDMMEAGLGSPVAADGALARGDLVFWKGHVGVMRDPATLLHASGWHMQVVSEPLSGARARIAAGGGGDVTGLRRLAPQAAATARS